MPRHRYLFAATATALIAPAISAPIVLDTPAKAASGVLAAHHIALDPGYNFISYNLDKLQMPRGVATFALTHLNATTTPAATLAGTVSVPCPVSGKMYAKLLTSPYWLKLQFVDCKAPGPGGTGTQILGGTMDMVLPSASFVPSVVHSLRAGTDTSYLKHQRDFTSGGVPIRVRRLYNVNISGTLPVTTGLSGYGVLGGFSFSLNGFTDSVTQVLDEIDPTLPPVAEHHDRSTAASMYVSGNRAISVDGSAFVDDVSLWGGRLTHRNNIGTPTLSESWLRPFVVNIHRQDDEVASTTNTTLNGGLEFSWHSYEGAGCLNGEYRFETVTDLFTLPGMGGNYQAGQLVANGVTRSRYFPAPLPDRMRINISTPGVGVFNYTTLSGARAALRTAAGCL